MSTFLTGCCPTSSLSKQVASESVHGAQLAALKLDAAAAHCDSCVEECTPCKCESRSRLAAAAADSGEHRRTSSFAHSVINMVGMLIGLGQLSTPYALENGGWASAFLLIGLGVITAYTAHIIGRCLDDEPAAKTYQDIGEQAFGRKGRIIASTFIYLEIFFALVSYTISLSDNLPLVFPGAGAAVRVPGLHMSTTQLLTVFAVLVALPSLWLRNLSSISFLSFFGILMSFLIFTTVCLTALFAGGATKFDISVLQLNKIPLVSGLYMFSYAGHIVFPNIYTAMKDPSKFTKVSIVSFAIVTTLYTSLAFIGARLFGAGVNAQITLSMPRHLAVTKIALWATVLTPMTKYALEFAPFAIQLEHSLPKEMSPRTKMAVRGAVGSVLLLVILTLALTVPYFQYVLSLTGSLVSVAVSLVFPCAFYLKVYWRRVPAPVAAANAAIIVLGAALGAVGAASSGKSLLQSMIRGHTAEATN